MIRPRAGRKAQPAPRSLRTPGLLESHVQRTVTELPELDGWRAIRTEHAIERHPGGGFKRRVGEIGMPDYLYIRYDSFQSFMRAGSIIWIEFKKPGEKLRPHQLAWHVAERKRGALVLVVDDINEFQSWYNISGLKRH